MEDKLVTLAILTYSKAQILKNVLENNGIEAYIHNVNLIQPIVSSGVRIRIKETDLPKALKIIESSAWLSDDVVGEKELEKDSEEVAKILIPIDFSSYTIKVIETGFALAEKINAEIVLLHVYFVPIYASSLPYGDVFNYQIADEEVTQNAIQKVHDDLNEISNTIKEKIAAGTFPEIKYSCILREGIPEEEILKFSKENKVNLIIMGTRGKNQKDIDLIGSVTAEVIDRSKVSVLAIPENTLLLNYDQKKKVAFLTNFDQRDLIAFDSFITHSSMFNFSVCFVHLAETKDAWNEIKLAGIKDYFQKQYPDLTISYDIVQDDDLLNSLDNYIKSNSVDYIAMTSYKRNIFSRLFNPGLARKMIFHSDIPLLVIK